MTDPTFFERCFQIVLVSHILLRLMARSFGYLKKKHRIGTFNSLATEIYRFLSSFDLLVLSITADFLSLSASLST